MEKVKTSDDRTMVPAAEWVQRLAEETAAFTIVRVVEAHSKRIDQQKMEWDQVITLSIKPDPRHVD